MKKDILENISEKTNHMWGGLIEKGFNNGLVVNGLGEVQLLDGRYVGNVIATGNRNIQRKIKELLSSKM